MRAAAMIYLVSAIAVLGSGIFLLLTSGAGIGLVVLVLLAGTLLVLAFRLLGGNSVAHRRAIVVSSFVSLGFFLVPVYTYIQNGWAVVSGRWGLLAPFLIVAMAHALAVVFLFRAKPPPP